ncbi:hypothetical protein D9757_009154 [Collybiopsis confluens]|uniref:MFS general substrate transporter n=1 Tax=Collybiopsis confluens TaxID=2823264 RepID=A0A8H5H7V6_9AGAR|nr:hypothetical protein D9757_009154 [Collybiopsis confluens]
MTTMSQQVTMIHMTPSSSESRLDVKSSESSKEKGVHVVTEHNLVEERGKEAEEDTRGGGSDSEPPDGGFRAWLVVMGAMASTFTTSVGYPDVYICSPFHTHCCQIWICQRLGSLPGILPAEHTEEFITFLNVNLPHLRSSGYLSTYDLIWSAWIGSIQYALVFLPGLPIGRLFDLGYFRSILLSASAILIVATFLIPECTKFWHFLLCQGLATGLACGAFFGPVTAVLAMWFKKRRSLALGLFATGSSLGGTVIPIAVKNLIPRIGFAWTVRVIGFILFAGLAVANLALKRRVPPSPHSEGIFNLRMFKPFKSPGFTIYCVSSFFIYLGFYTLLTYVSVTATSIGVSESFSFYLVAIANGSSGVGRVVAGWCGDKVGAMNVLVPFTALTGVMTCIWPFMRSEGALIAVVVIYGQVPNPSRQWYLRERCWFLYY